MFTIYLIIGAIAGILSGLLGIGGAIIIIPCLLRSFQYLPSIPNSYAMHMAIGTSLATVVVTGLSALRAHQRRQAVRWDMILMMLPGLILGSMCGALIANYLSSNFLRIIFGVFLFLMGCQLFFTKPYMSSQVILSKKVFVIFGFFVGILASILGVGGGVFIIPFLMFYRIDMRQLAGTTVGCGVIVGAFGTISYLLTGLFSPVTIPWSIGYIYGPAFLGVSMTSILFAPIGAQLAHKLPISLLKRIFAVFLLMIAADMLFFSK